MLRVAVLFPVFLALAACMKAPDPELGLRRPGAEPAAPEGPPEVHFAALEGWTATPTDQGFQVARWELPDGGLATISWLGNSMEIVAMNLDRWLGQWETASGDARADARIELVESGVLPYTYVEVRGTLRDTRQVGESEPLPDWMLLGAIVESAQGPLYVKVVAPESVIGRDATAFRAAVDAIDVH